MEPVFKTVDDLYGRITTCNDCCEGDYKSFHCPLCEVDHFKPTRRAAVMKHLFLSHWQTRIQSTEDVGQDKTKGPYGNYDDDNCDYDGCLMRTMLVLLMMIMVVDDNAVEDDMHCPGMTGYY